MGGFDNPYDDEDKLLDDFAYMFNTYVWITPRLANNMTRVLRVEARCNMVKLKVKKEGADE